MRFAHFFVDRPIFASVLSIVLVLVGYVSYTRLPIAQYPEIAPPTITVRATYPGANAETVAATVATPIEQEINGVEDMLYMSSYSSADGAMQLTITFKPGTNLDQANVLVQNRVATATPRLPAEVRSLGVVTRKASSDFLMVVHMLSPDDSFDQLYISNYALIRVRDELIRLEGVGDVTVFGAREYSMRIWLDPNKLAAYRLSTTDVTAALQEQNIQVAGGALGGPPTPQGSAFQLIVQTQGRFHSVNQFQDIIVKAVDGRLVRLRELGRVELGARDYTTGSYLDGKPAIGIGIFQRPGTNAIAAAEAIIAKMQQLQLQFPKGLEYKIAYNPTTFVEQSVFEVYKTLGEAVILVIIVILVFLQSWRTAIIPIVAIPVSLIGTFALMSAFGFSLNSLSLFGLVLAIGIVVDDAIVVVENVERQIADGKTPREAAHVTMDEVGSAVIAIALVLSAVFIPTAFIPGISGQFYRQFALTIAVATVISALNSLTLSPALCALLLKPHRGEHHKPRFFLARWGAALANGFNKTFDVFSNGYAALVRFLVSSVFMRLVMLGVYAAMIATTVYLARTTPTGFIPAQDQGYLIAVVQLPDGASLNRTEEVMKQAEKIIADVPGIESIISISGFNGATFTNATNGGVMFLPLKPFEQRKTPNLAAGAIAGQVIMRLSVIQEAMIFALPPPPVRGLGNAGGFKMMLQDRTGAGLGALLASAGEVIGQANQNPNLSRVFTTFGNNTPQIYLNIDRTKARMLDVPLSNIFNTLQVNLGGAYVNDFNVFGRVYQVRIQADDRFRTERQDILRLKVRSSNGALVPLGSLVDITDVAGADLVQRYNMYTAVPIQGDSAPGVSSGTALSAMEGLAARLPDTLGYEWTELAFQERAVGNTAIYVFALGVLFVFLVLSAQYESWSLPLAIILVVPTGVLAALAGVGLRGMDNNVLTQIGLVVLIGLAAKNAILIVEFAKQIEELENKAPVPAVVEAARLRLRPILMTAFAFILGVVPLVIATGPGAEMRQALGTAVFFGMSGATVFGLFLTPVFYIVIRTTMIWFGNLGKRKSPPPSQEPPSDGPAPSPGSVPQGAH
ncbi:efflux RND transporter permease subunit [Enterovirga rhinocerotis]|uniref:Efflux pump membrane transporter n=1 Tax=Enterovirga rhinocerotis TaxID=1339210 RepID=A0A4R7C724_9HYPH|nr:multidrug efflux RND transporter permease subunit [Enterovirga rhinocerotis]TDR94404.1 hydrophobe/amphiphile efflux-1 (HAE1) family protein [Enterovirga rhinocerotis]